MLYAAPALPANVNTVVLTIVWVLAIGLGIMEYGRSNGRIGRALGVAFGGALLATFIIEPALLTEYLPNLFLALIKWVLGVA
jgi:hypothetical protein